MKSEETISFFGNDQMRVNGFERKTMKIRNGSNRVGFDFDIKRTTFRHCFKLV